MRHIRLLVAVLLLGGLTVGAQANNMPQMPQAPGTQENGPPVPPPLPGPMPAPAPAVPVETPEWFYGLDGQALGPVTVSQLQQLAATGQITGDTPVWKQGMAGWQRLGDTPELGPVVASMPKKDGSQPPPPPKTQELLDQKMKQFVTGTWRFDGPVTQGSITAFVKVEINYRPDGSYAGMQSIQMPPMGGIQAPPSVIARSGRWAVTGVSESEMVLTLTEYGQGPSQVGLRIIDQNTVEDTSNLLRSYRIR